MKLTLDRKLLVGVSAALVVLTLGGGLIGRTATVEGTYDYLRVFNEALYLAVNNYVEPIEIDTLMQGAYRGMLESLDPVNEYLAPEQFQKASRGENAGPAGIGLSVSKRHGYVVVVASAAGSPAAAAGLGTGDAILTIDGHTTRMMGAWQAGQALRGKSGTKVVLNISPRDGGDRKTITLERKVVPPAAPTGSSVGDAGVVRIAGIREGDARRLNETIASLRTQGIKRLLLDLRGCSSESLAEPIGMASLFITDGVIVTVADRQDGDRAYRADGRRRAWDGPLAVLVDEGTSRGCEALAAALRDGLGAAVVGQKTWGAGTVTALLPLRNNDGVILATGLMQSPTGKEWNGAGLDPDLVIAGDVRDEGDPQRQKAIEYLRGLGVPAGRAAA
jgi:carboxyl-terminal processing protease